MTVSLASVPFNKILEYLPRISFSDCISFLALIVAILSYLHSQKAERRAHRLEQRKEQREQRAALVSISQAKSVLQRYIESACTAFLENSMGKDYSYFLLRYSEFIGYVQLLVGERVLTKKDAKLCKHVYGILKSVAKEKKDKIKIATKATKTLLQNGQPNQKVKKLLAKLQ